MGQQQQKKQQQRKPQQLLKLQPPRPPPPLQLKPLPPQLAEVCLALDCCVTPQQQLRSLKQQQQKKQQLFLQPQPLKPLPPHYHHGDHSTLKTDWTCTILLHLLHSLMLVSSISLWYPNK